MISMQARCSFHLTIFGYLWHLSGPNCYQHFNKSPIFKPQILHLTLPHPFRPLPQCSWVCFSGLWSSSHHMQTHGDAIFLFEANAIVLLCHSELLHDKLRVANCRQQHQCTCMMWHLERLKLAITVRGY